MMCDRCAGRGWLKEAIPSPMWGRAEVEYETYDCDKCNGTGEVEEA